MLYVNCKSPPTDLSFSVFVRGGAREWSVGPVAFGRGMASRMQPLYSSTLRAGTPTGPTVDVIFRPDPEAALMLNPDVRSYWNGEVVFKNVQLIGRSTQLLRPTPSPATPPRRMLWDGIQFEQRRKEPIDGTVTF
jgi:hypothetical protein